MVIRSNIHEYLFRYRKDLYANSLIDDLDYVMSVTSFPGDKSTCPMKGFKRAMVSYLPFLAPDSNEELMPFNYSDDDSDSDEYYSE